MHRIAQWASPLLVAAGAAAATWMAAQATHLSAPKPVSAAPPIAVIAKPIGNGDSPTSADVPVTSAIPPSKTPSQVTPTIQCVRRAKPSVITIRDFESQKVFGTGVIIDDRGYAVTNSHVVQAAKKVAVHFLDKSDDSLEGDVIVVDRDHDLALIRFANAGKLKAIEFGADSTDIEVGQSVIAIGNPFGYTGTVSVGIVSALEREVKLPWGPTLTKLIQTDAGSINVGTSGGPLLDLDGKMIGILFAAREGGSNISFAIPVESVRRFVKAAVPE